MISRLRRNGTNGITLRSLPKNTCFTLQMPVGRQAPVPTLLHLWFRHRSGRYRRLLRPAMPGKKPTRASLRALTSQLCPTIAQLDLFCTGLLSAWRGSATVACRSRSAWPDAPALIGSDLAEAIEPAETLRATPRWWW